MQPKYQFKQQTDICIICITCIICGTSGSSQSATRHSPATCFKHLDRCRSTHVAPCNLSAVAIPRQQFCHEREGCLARSPSGCHPGCTSTVCPPQHKHIAFSDDILLAGACQATRRKWHDAGPLWSPRTSGAVPDETPRRRAQKACMTITVVLTHVAFDGVLCSTGAAWLDGSVGSACSPSLLRARHLLFSRTIDASATCTILSSACAGSRLALPHHACHFLRATRRAGRCTTVPVWGGPRRQCHAWRGMSHTPLPATDSANLITTGTRTPAIACMHGRTTLKVCTRSHEVI